VFKPTEKSFDFIEKIDSATFKLEELLPINDIDISGDHLFAAVGNKGIGYAQINAALTPSILTNIQFIDLSSINEIKSISLDDSIYKQI
jgi:hypothetical protein